MLNSSGETAALGLPAGDARIAATDREVRELQQRGRCVHGEGVECRLVVCKGAGSVGQHTYCIQDNGVLNLCKRCKRVEDLGEEVAQLERIAHEMSRSQEQRGHEPLPPWKAMELLAEKIGKDGLWSSYTGNELRLTEVRSHDSLTPVLSNMFDPRGYYGGFEFCEATFNTMAPIRDRAQLIEIAELHEQSVAFLPSVCTEKKPATMSLYARWEEGGGDTCSYASVDTERNSGRTEEGETK